MNNKIFQLKPIINRVYESESLFQIQTVCFICSIQQQKPFFCRIFFIICAKVLKASIDWSMQTDDSHISVIKKQRHIKL